MGKRSSFERRPQDAYDTPAAAVEPLLPYLSGAVENRMWALATRAFGFAVKT
jgi:hypothetical protein